MSGPRTAIYVLHCFKKKSTKGIATPKDIEVIIQRLAAAEQDPAAERSTVTLAGTCDLVV